MLESKAVTKLFGAKTAVDHISLKLEKGHVYAMLGPNGSGKTTWMKMAAGLIKPTSGEVRFLDVPVNIDSRRHVAYMSTEPYFYAWMTVKDVGKYYSDFFQDFSYSRYQDLLRRMELTEDMKTRSLSSGMMSVSSPTTPFSPTVRSRMPPSPSRTTEVTSPVSESNHAFVTKPWTEYPSGMG